MVSWQRSIFFVAITWLSFVVHATEQDEIVSIVVGQTHVIKSSNIQRVAIGNGDVIETHHLSEEQGILIVGKKAGVTDLKLWQKGQPFVGYKVRVVADDLDVHFQELTALLQGIEGVSVTKTDFSIHINGLVVRQEDFNLVKQTSEKYPHVINHIQMPVVELTTMIMLDVKVVELKRNKLAEIGVQWDRVLQGPAADVEIMNASAKWGLGLNSRISSAIRLMEENGNAKLLAEPKLVAKSGTRAEFLAGGEVPIPITDEEEVTVAFKKYGVILNVEPKADQFGYVDAHIEVEVSTVDPSVSSMGIPGFLTRKTDTEMNIKSGETIVLSGLLSQEQSKSVQKMPGLGHIPILGELFKSRGFRNNETELVIFVTPHIMHNDKLWLTKHAERAASFSENLQFSILD